MGYASSHGLTSSPETTPPQIRNPPPCGRRADFLGIQDARSFDGKGDVGLVQVRYPEFDKRGRECF